MRVRRTKSRSIVKHSMHIASSWRIDAWPQSKDILTLSYTATNFIAACEAAWDIDSESELRLCRSIRSLHVVSVPLCLIAIIGAIKNSRPQNFRAESSALPKYFRRAAAAL